ncbi:universal stress protein [Halovivax gelatinilyticus]|uniref:universal stress protein n=1 Tax=Halovivax gelatinilyticus TaxID=2961597 RepID=UPI0020CA889B|nr:universal stress protein [Halovivax gelatinilyticus]
MSRFIESILVPTDGSEGAVAGADHGIALASRLGADVHVLSVVDAPDGPSTLDEETLSVFESAAEDAAETVADLAAEFDPDLSVRTTVRSGTPFQSIREYAHRHETDAIVMGTKGRTGLDRFLLGSVTENVLRTAHVPVLAVPPNADPPPVETISFDRLLLPTDGSEGAAIATEWAIALASALDSTVDALYSVDTSRFRSAAEPADVLTALEERGETTLESVRERARDAGVSVTGSVASGAPARVILAYADESPVDAIVMGTHGQTGIGQWFLGSVTENVLRGADVPVWCVPVSATHPQPNE